MTIIAYARGHEVQFRNGAWSEPPATACACCGREPVYDLDACLAPIVRALQAAGIDTLWSCCGHGLRRGEIMLADGRSLRIERRQP